MRAPALALIVSLAGAASLLAQSAPLPRLVRADTTPYVPRYELPKGRQIVVVYVGGSETDSLKALGEAIRDMKPLLARQAAQRGLPLSIIGVSLDWEVEKSFARLHAMGAWDELVLGNNWINVGAQHYLWLRPDGQPTTPQVIVLERTITAGDRKIEFGEERRVAWFQGWDAIVGWVRTGAPLPAQANR